VASTGTSDAGGYFTSTGTGTVVRAVRGVAANANATSGARHYGGYFDGSGASAADARNIGVLGTNSISTSGATTIGVYGDGYSGDTTVGVWG